MHDSSFNKGTSAPAYATLDDWVQKEAIPFAVDTPESFNAAIDKVVASLDGSVELLGFGEALHGGGDLLLFRNRLFRRLVEAHRYSAIAIESSFPRGCAVNEYIAGRGAESYDAIEDRGFSHGFGRLEANRELVEWLRLYNADPAHPVKLHFYGFDSPTEMGSSDGPRQLLHFVFDYLVSVDDARGRELRKRINPLLGRDAEWEDPAAIMDPAKSVGLSPAAAALRIETEDLIAEMSIRRPEFAAKRGDDRYLEAVHCASAARQLLNYHAALARSSGDRVAKLLGLRDAMMADNLAYIVSRERERGRVLAFAHNSHLQRGKAQWQLGPDLCVWWPAGAQLQEIFGRRYALIGSAVGVYDAQGIGRPEAGTLESRLRSVPGPGRLIPTHRGRRLPASAIAALPTRSGSQKNPTYFALTPQSLTDFDWLVLLDSAAEIGDGFPKK